MLAHRASLVLVFATFALLLIGGTVNPTGSSLACPEPTVLCNGQLFPEMVGGVFYEHGHRLAAMLVGFLQIGLTLILWFRRRDLRWLGVLALLMVCVQGTLGAITVGLKLPWVVSTAHLLLAMSYLAMLLYIAARTGPVRPWSGDGNPQPVRKWLGIAAVCVLAQIALGGMVRHHEAALATLQFPLHNGSLWPAGAPIALKLHMAHRIGGVLVTLVVLACSVVLYLGSKYDRGLRWRALILPSIVFAQVTLGIAVIFSYRAVPVAVLHFGGGALLWSILIASYFRAKGVDGRVRSDAVVATNYESDRVVT